MCEYRHCIHICECVIERQIHILHSHSRMPSHRLMPLKWDTHTPSISYIMTWLMLIGPVHAVRLHHFTAHSSYHMNNIVLYLPNLMKQKKSKICGDVFFWFSIAPSPTRIVCVIHNPPAWRHEPTTMCDIPSQMQYVSMFITPSLPWQWDTLASLQASPGRQCVFFFFFLFSQRGRRLNLTYLSSWSAGKILVLCFIFPTIHF